MDHAIEESPKEQVSLNAGPECPCDDLLVGDEVALGVSAQVDKNERREEERADKVE